MTGVITVTNQDAEQVADIVGLVDDGLTTAGGTCVLDAPFTGVVLTPGLRGL
jgi:hypothetical protein